LVGTHYKTRDRGRIRYGKPRKGINVITKRRKEEWEKRQEVC